MISRLSVAVVLSGALLGSTAYARDAEGLGDGLTASNAGSQDLDLAAKHFEDGVRLYREGRYDLARVEFEAAFAVSRAPDLLHNLSMVAERQGKLPDAIDYEQRFYDARRAELTEREADETLGRLVRLRAMLQGGAFSAPAAPSMTQAAQPGRRSRPPAGSIGLIAGGAGVLLGGIGCGIGALLTAKTISDGGTYNALDYQALVDRGQALNSAAIALDVVGGVALAAGTIWGIAHRLRHRTEAAALQPSGTGLAVYW